MSENKLIVKKLTKSFKNRRVVSNVNFHVSRGEIVGLLGPNGAGKTTSFYMTVGLMIPDSGEVILNDKNITQVPLHKRARLGIGYLPQNASVFRKLSVEDNLLAIMEVWGIDSSQRDEFLERLLEQFNISHIRKSLGVSLSGGERRRLEIARALILSPKFLLLDEPFAGIDPVTVAEIQELIKNLVSEQKIGVLITDHNVRETLSSCHRAYILAEGRILAEGYPHEISRNEIVKKVYLGKHFKL